MPRSIAVRDGMLFALGVLIVVMTPPFRDPQLLTPILSVGLVLLAAHRFRSPTATAWLSPPTWLLSLWVVGVAVGAVLWLLGPFFLLQLD